MKLIVFGSFYETKITSNWFQIWAEHFKVFHAHGEVRAWKSEKFHPIFLWLMGRILNRRWFSFHFNWFEFMIHFLGNIDLFLLKKMNQFFRFFIKASNHRSAKTQSSFCDFVWQRAITTSTYFIGIWSNDFLNELDLFLYF